MVSNEENYVPKRKYAPPPPPPTTKAKVEPTSQPTTGPSSDLEPAFGQFMRMMTELIKKETKKEDKQGNDAKENVYEILNIKSIKI
ncbi:unnamed protein product [Cylicocyclus nassatus]|uniref:Uncharacterized protein n=1 Tax=Cylicocyclus nassatus TaxID=53992 RepID=A0AA36MEI3_CYLNA|nr:unnamed protein product [Cylicocyclus nassatus]